MCVSGWSLGICPVGVNSLYTQCSSGVLLAMSIDGNGLPRQALSFDDSKNAGADEKQKLMSADNKRHDNKQQPVDVSLSSALSAARRRRHCLWSAVLVFLVGLTLAIILGTEHARSQARALRRDYYSGFSLNTCRLEPGNGRYRPTFSFSLQQDVGSAAMVEESASIALVKRVIFNVTPLVGHKGALRRRRGHAVRVLMRRKDDDDDDDDDDMMHILMFADRRSRHEQRRRMQSRRRHKRWHRQWHGRSIKNHRSGQVTVLASGAHSRASSASQVALELGSAGASIPCRHSHVPGGVLGGVLGGLLTTTSAVSVVNLTGSVEAVTISQWEDTLSSSSEHSNAIGNAWIPILSVCVGTCFVFSVSVCAYYGCFYRKNSAERLWDAHHRISHDVRYIPVATHTHTKPRNVQNQIRDRKTETSRQGHTHMHTQRPAVDQRQPRPVAAAATAPT